MAVTAQLEKLVSALRPQFHRVVKIPVHRAVFPLPPLPQRKTGDLHLDYRRVV